MGFLQSFGDLGHELIGQPVRLAGVRHHGCWEMLQQTLWNVGTVEKTFCFRAVALWHGELHELSFVTGSYENGKMFDV